MKSSVSAVAALLMLAGGAAAQEPPAGNGPRGSSQAAPGERRYDAVGRVAVEPGAGIVAITDALPDRSFAEVTALDSGRTIVVAVDFSAPAPGTIATLSVAAAEALGIGGADRAAVRVRSAVMGAQEGAALRSGVVGTARPDAPPALLAALRRRLGTDDTAVAPSRARPPARKVAPPPARAKPVASTPRPAMPATVRSGYAVQVAALSSASRATAVAAAIGGQVLPGPPLWRVRLGPFADAAAATRAKADVARRGYPAAQIIRYP